MSHVLPSGRPAYRPSVLRGKHWTLRVNLLIPTMVIGTIDVFDSIALSVILTLFGSHKVSAKQNLLASFFSKTLQAIRMKFDMEQAIQVERYDAIFIFHFLERLNETRKITTVLLTVSTSFYIAMHSEVHESIWVEQDRYY